jgi:hypothetical protein
MWWVQGAQKCLKSSPTSTTFGLSSAPVALLEDERRWSLLWHFKVVKSVCTYILRQCKPHARFCNGQHPARSQLEQQPADVGAYKQESGVCGPGGPLSSQHGAASSQQPASNDESGGRSSWMEAGGAEGETSGMEGRPGSSWGGADGKTVWWNGHCINFQTRPAQQAS